MPAPAGAPSEADSQAPALAEGIVRDPDDPPYEARPRASRGDDVALLGNDELVRIFYEIGDMLEIGSELPSRSARYGRCYQPRLGKTWAPVLSLPLRGRAS